MPSLSLGHYSYRSLHKAIHLSHSALHRWLDFRSKPPLGDNTPRALLVSCEAASCLSWERL